MTEKDLPKSLDLTMLFFVAVIGVIAIEIIFALLENAAMTNAARYRTYRWSFYTIFAWWFFCLLICIRSKNKRNQEGRSKKRLAIKIILFLFLAFAFTTAGKTIYIIVGIPNHMIFTILVERHRLKHNTDHEALAKACQAVVSNWEYYKDREWDDPEFPLPIRQVRPNYISVSDDGIRMEMHGGHDHYGFQFRQQLDDTWQLEYYTEGSHEVLVSDLQ